MVCVSIAEEVGVRLCAVDFVSEPVPVVVRVDVTV